MKIMRIEGNKKLTGTIKISGAKNSSVALLPASLLADDDVTICAKMTDGSIIEGEHHITLSPKKISSVYYKEEPVVNEEVIKVTFAEAFQKVQEVNLPKPHTRQVVLRKQVGPVEANPQWIFGNLHSQIYVDAVTGAVSKDNPAFDGLNLGTPLGEWP